MTPTGYHETPTYHVIVKIIGGCYLGRPVSHLGELAALSTAACWAVSALAFTAAGARVGSLTVNLLRLVMALGFLTAMNLVMRGTPLPTDAPAHAWLWLSASGLVGFGFGDLCLFRAFLLIGPRLSTLMMSLVPIFTALFGWTFLHEVLSAKQIIGMLLVISGVVFAVSEKKATSAGTKRPSATGILLGIAGALGQAGGLVLSKHGMENYSDSTAANQIRVIAAVIAFSLLFVALRWWPRVISALRDRKGLGIVGVGAFFGPFIGVSLSLVAVHHALAGVAASLMATTPIIILPLAYALRKERVGWRGIGGAVIAVGGAIFILW